MNRGSGTRTRVTLAREDIVIFAREDMVLDKETPHGLRGFPPALFRAR